MKHDSEAITVRLYELLLIALAGLCIGIGIFSQSVTPAVPDFLGLRIGLAVLALVAAGTLYVAPFLWRFAGPITYATLTLHAVLHLYFLYASQLAYAQSIGLVLVVALTAVSLHDVKWMLGYSVLVGGTATAIGFLLPATSLHPVLLATAMTAVPILGYVAVQSRRIIEDELVATIDEAEVAVRAKAEFLATMSHEIRTPMNGVLGMATLLGDTELTDTQRDYVETIRLSGDTLLTIINDILDFSKIEADRLELEETPFELRPMIEEALDLLASKAYEKPVDLVCHVDEDVPPALLGDVTRLRQVIVNLVGNAIKFTEQGAVLVSVKKRRSVGGEHELLFTVRDTGIGIPADRIDRLFSSFSQVDSSHTRKYGGTGLGLAISKKLAELMGGSMWVESEVGRGSTFSFTILARASAALSRAPLKGKQALLAGKRLLVVEDSVANREALCAQLREWGLTITAAPRGVEALRLLREGGHFDAAVVDMQLEDMDGLALARSIGEHHPEQRDIMPLVGFTAPGHPVQTDGLFAAVLSKPIKQVPLHQALLRLLGMENPDVKAPDVDEHGIWIQRDRSIPSAEDVQKALIAAKEDAPIMPPLRLLLAEDNAVNQKVALRILERLGYDADLAENGQDVLDAFSSNTYDAILMDVQMPELDGLQATERLRATLPPERQPRIIAMTANAMEGDREQCLNAGMDDYLSKPIRREDLVQALLLCKPLSAIRPDAAPLGASTAIPIRRVDELELPAFARTPDTPALPLRPKPSSPAPPSSKRLESDQFLSEPPFDPPHAEGADVLWDDVPVPLEPTTAETPVPTSRSTDEKAHPPHNPFRRPIPSLSVPQQGIAPDSAPRSDASPPATDQDFGQVPEFPEYGIDNASLDATSPTAEPPDTKAPDASALFPLPPAPSLDASAPSPPFHSTSPPEPVQPPTGTAPPPPPSFGAFETLSFEVPTPDEESPEFTADDDSAFNASSFDTPSFESPSFDTPSLEPPGFEPPGFDTLDFEAPSFDTLSFDAPTFDPLPDETVPDAASPSETPIDEVPPPGGPPSGADAFNVGGLVEDPAFSFPSFESAPPPPPAPAPSRAESFEAESFEAESFEAESFEAESFEAESFEAESFEAAPSLPAPEVILETLRVVSGLDDPEFAREVLEGYLRTDLTLIGAVVEGMRTHSYKDVTASVHKLKSSAATLGATALADRYATLEAESRLGHFEADVPARAQAIREATFAFRHQIQSALKLLG